MQKCKQTAKNDTFYWFPWHHLLITQISFDIYLVNVKTMRKIAEIFVAFSEKLNFNKGSFTNTVDKGGPAVQKCGLLSTFIR